MEVVFPLMLTLELRRSAAHVWKPKHRWHPCAEFLKVVYLFLRFLVHLHKRKFTKCCSVFSSFSFLYHSLIFGSFLLAAGWVLSLLPVITGVGVCLVFIWVFYCLCHRLIVLWHFNSFHLCLPPLWWCINSPGSAPLGAAFLTLWSAVFIPFCLWGFSLLDFFLGFNRLLKLAFLCNVLHTSPTISRHSPKRWLTCWPCSRLRPRLCPPVLAQWQQVAGGFYIVVKKPHANLAFSDLWLTDGHGWQKSEHQSYMHPCSKF